jgi:hypothetical protein
LDFDWQSASALWAAYDPDGRVVYLHDAYSARRAELALVADAIRSRGRYVGGVINPTAHGRTREEGTQLIEELWKNGIHVSDIDQAIEVGIVETANLLSAARLRVFETAAGWINEYPLYRRDEKGRPNDTDCPLMASTALLAPVVPLLRIEAEADDADDPVDEGGRSEVTGY